MKVSRFINNWMGGRSALLEDYDDYPYTDVYPYGKLPSTGVTVDFMLKPSLVVNDPTQAIRTALTKDKLFDEFIRMKSYTSFLRGITDFFVMKILELGEFPGLLPTTTKGITYIMDAPTTEYNETHPEAVPLLNNYDILMNVLKEECFSVYKEGLLISEDEAIIDFTRYRIHVDYRKSNRFVNAFNNAAIKKYDGMNLVAYMKKLMSETIGGHGQTWHYLAARLVDNLSFNDISQLFEMRWPSNIVYRKEDRFGSTAPNHHFKLFNYLNELHVTSHGQLTGVGFVTPYNDSNVQIEMSRLSLNGFVAPAVSNITVKSIDYLDGWSNQINTAKVYVMGIPEKFIKNPLKLDFKRMFFDREGNLKNIGDKSSGGWFPMQWGWPEIVCDAVSNHVFADKLASSSIGDIRVTPAKDVTITFDYNLLANEDPIRSFNHQALHTAFRSTDFHTRPFYITITIKILKMTASILDHHPVDISLSNFFYNPDYGTNYILDLGGNCAVYGLSADFKLSSTQPAKLEVRNEVPAKYNGKYIPSVIRYGGFTDTTDGVGELASSFSNHTFWYFENMPTIIINPASRHANITVNHKRESLLKRIFLRLTTHQHIQAFLPASKYYYNAYSPLTDSYPGGVSIRISEGSDYTGRNVYQNEMVNNEPMTLDYINKTTHLLFLKNLGDKLNTLVICVDDDYVITSDNRLESTYQWPLNVNSRTTTITPHYKWVLNDGVSLQMVVFCKEEHFKLIDQDKFLTVDKLKAMNLPPVVPLNVFHQCFKNINEEVEFFGIKMDAESIDNQAFSNTIKTRLKSKL